MNQPLLSIIIPVYNNSQSDIVRCFNSIKEQKCDDYEVIIVDDGSNESCASFLDKIIGKLNKFKVIHKKIKVFQWLAIKASKRQQANI